MHRGHAYTGQTSGASSGGRESQVVPGVLCEAKRTLVQRFEVMQAILQIELQRTGFSESMNCQSNSPSGL